MTKRTALVTSFLAFGVSSSALASQATFYGEPAGWLFDLIKSPTSKRNFSIIVNWQKVGCTQVKLNDLIECTIHGKTPEYPASSAEAQKALCSIKGNDIKTIFGETRGGSISFEADAAKSVYEILSRVDWSTHVEDLAYTITKKSFGRSGTHGISCTQVLPDGNRQPVTYSCDISWR